MNEAQNAIIDFTEALEEYGSDITLRKVTKGSYNPLTGTDDTYTEVELKALIKDPITDITMRNLIGDYDMTLAIYHTEAPTKQDKVIYQNEVYNIKRIVPAILQNTVIKYGLLVGK